VRLLKSEFLKLAYQRRTWGLLASAIFLAVLATAFSPYAIAKLAKEMPMALSSPDVIDGIYAKALGAYILTLILGIVIMSSEFHHHTAIATFLVEPKRSRVLTAKLITAAVWGGGFNLIATAVGMASGAFALTLFKNVGTPHSYIFVNYPLAAVVIGAVLAVVGVGIGTLIRNQNGAVAVGLVWFLIVDRILAVIWTEAGKYLPSGLITAMMTLHLNVKDRTTGFGINTADYLDPLPAAGLLLVYALVFAAISIATTLRRDID